MPVESPFVSSTYALFAKFAVYATSSRQPTLWRMPTSFSFQRTFTPLQAGRRSGFNRISENKKPGFERRVSPSILPCDRRRTASLEARIPFIPYLKPNPPRRSSFGDCRRVCRCKRLPPTSREYTRYFRYVKSMLRVALCKTQPLWKTAWEWPVFAALRVSASNTLVRCPPAG